MLGLMVVLSSCKDKEEDTPEVYVSFASKIIGSWELVSSTDNNTQSTTSYPESIDPLVITFQSNSKLKFEGPCNDGISNVYLVTETGALQVYALQVTNLFCSNTEEDWETRTRSSLGSSYHASISGSTLSILSNGPWSITLVRK